MIALIERLLEFDDVQKLKSIVNLPSKWQTYPTVYDHTVAVIEQACKLYPYSKIMLVCAAFHDIGKILTKKEKDGFIIFPGHADISNIMVKENNLLRILFDDKFISGSEVLECQFIIHHHMRPMGAGLWTKESAKHLIFHLKNKNNDMFDHLIKFTDIDIRGSNPNRIPTDSLWTKEIQSLNNAIEELNRGT
jgi:hypothetical protein